jgi:hypothetical protein
VVVGLVIATTGCTSAAASPATNTQAAATILIQSPGLYPEGVEWDAVGHRFLVSSAARGSVTAVNDNGSTTTIDSGEGLTSTLGTHLDEERRRLLVTVADFSAVNDSTRPGEAKLAV